MREPILRKILILTDRDLPSANCRKNLAGGAEFSLDHFFRPARREIRF